MQATDDLQWRRRSCERMRARRLGEILVDLLMQMPEESRRLVLKGLAEKAGNAE